MTAPEGDTCDIRVVGTPAPQGSKTRMPNGAMVEGSSTSGRASLAAWRHAIADACARHLEADPHGPLPAPIEITITFVLPQPKSGPHRFRHATKPDLDKAARAVLDQLVRSQIIGDDAGVFALQVSKWYARLVPPGAHITVKSHADRESADRQLSKDRARLARAAAKGAA